MIRMKPPLLQFFGLLAIGLTVVLNGCFVPMSYDVSVPREIPPGTTGKINNETITLELPDLTLSAQVQAYNWDGTYLLKPLGVWLELRPLNGSATLDPQQVTLKSNGGDDLDAVSFLGPSVAWSSPRAFAAGCGPRRYHSGIAITNLAVSQEWVMEARHIGDAGIFRPSVGPVPIEGKKCFMFWFDTDALPDHIFTLSIDGITMNGQKVPIPKIHFEKRSVSTVRGIP
jgi:hypothetical protein